MEPGSLQLSLTWDGAQIVAARVVSTRPPVARALCGLSAARVLEVVPRLFSLCRHAQGAAARLSLQAARAEPARLDARLNLGLNVALEAIAEHLHHLLISWPQMIGVPCRSNPGQELAFWRRRLQSVVDATTAVALAGELTTWLDELHSPQFDDLASADAVALLPSLSAAGWAPQVDGEAFSDLPTFAGQPAESGVLARHAGQVGVAALLAKGRRIRARLLARHAELRWLAQGLADLPRVGTLVDAATVGEGCGLARVETARGTLLHRIELAGDRVGRYLIVAPTEWNFHPQGAFVREITGCRVATHGDALLAAGRLALSLDPCVPYASSVDDA